MFAEAISIAQTAYDLYGMVSSIFRGNKTESILQEMNTRIERLSEHILYAPDMTSLRDINHSSQKYIDDLKRVKEGLEPVQRALKADILSSAIILTPEKTRLSMENNPWRLLNFIQPLSLASPPGEPNLMPVIFDYQAVRYIGWQKEGVIPILFDLEHVHKSLKTVLDETVGIETLGGILTPLFKKGTILPAASTQVFSTAADNQPAVSIHVVAGESEMVSEGRSLGNFEMDGIPPAPRGVPQIEIVFEVPKTGILSVKAIDKATGYTKAIEIGKLHSH